MRFYTHQSGDILVDGRPVGEYGISALRKNIAIVPQEVMLFAGRFMKTLLMEDRQQRGRPS
jgi:ATP-binding cassette subfamily B protein